MPESTISSLPRLDSIAGLTAKKKTSLHKAPARMTLVFLAANSPVESTQG